MTLATPIRVTWKGVKPDAFRDQPSLTGEVVGFVASPDPSSRTGVVSAVIVDADGRFTAVDLHEIRAEKV